jgi:release factor glutamine methyltransferase
MGTRDNRMNGGHKRRFMTLSSTREVLARAALRLADAGVDSPRLDARVLLAKALGVPGDVPFAVSNIDQDQVELFEALVARRAAREPLAYITGMKEFFSLEFEVGPGVLIPRPESETLVEEALSEFPDRDAALDVLDLGTGSGCLVIAFLEQRRHAQGRGVDSSPEALARAARNVGRRGLSQRCTLALGDWTAQGTFDVVFANPPYLTDKEFARAAPEISRHEPRSAFAAGQDGLAAYRALSLQVARLLKPGGLAFVELGAGQADAVARVFVANGLECRRVAPDLSGIPRCLIAGRLS